MGLPRGLSVSNYELDIPLVSVQFANSNVISGPFIWLCYLVTLPTIVAGCFHQTCVMIEGKIFYSYGYQYTFLRGIDFPYLRYLDLRPHLKA